MSRRALAAGAALLLAACAGANGGPETWLGSFGPPGTGVAKGTFAGDAFGVQSVISTTVPIGASSNEGVIILANVPDLCAKIEAGFQPPSGRYLIIRALEIDPDAPAPMKSPSAPETLRVISLDSPPAAGKVAGIDYVRTNSACSGLASPAARGETGDLRIERIDLGAAYTGAAEFTSDAGEHDLLTFTAEPCSSSAVASFLAGTLSCN